MGKMYLFAIFQVVNNSWSFYGIECQVQSVGRIGLGVWKDETSFKGKHKIWSNHSDSLTFRILGI